MVTGDIKVTMMVSTGIRVTKAIAKCLLSNSNCKDIKMLSTNSNDYHRIGIERQVIELYNQGKTTGDIAKELRMSLRDISIILRNNQVNHGIVITKDNGNDNNSNDTNNNKSPSQRATQAYELYNKGKEPVEVAIQLGLPEYKATKYYREYLELTGLYEVTFLYEEKKHCIPSLLKLNKILEREGIQDENDIANVFKYANELPNLQKYCQNLQNKVQDLKYQNQELERELQVRRRQIAELTEVENIHKHNIDTLHNDIERLYNEKCKIQRFVSKFRNNNRRYLQIKGIAEEVVDRHLAERKSLLNSALIAVVEALRMNPDRYAVIYNSKYDNNNDNIIESSASTTATTISSSPYSHSTKVPQNYYYNE